MKLRRRFNSKMLKTGLLLCMTILMTIGWSAAASAAYVTYTPIDVPTHINTSFKTYMDYRKVTDKQSSQYGFISTWGWVDDNGFMRCNGENDFGIEQDYYLVALGSHYGTQIGTKYRITTDTGNVFYAALGDQKDDGDTDASNRYATDNNDVVEFLVDTDALNSNVRLNGSANVYMPLNGSIASIEQITFIGD